MKNKRVYESNKILSNFNTLQKEISGEKAFEFVELVSHHHRIQASPGYREAAETCRKVLEENGVRACIQSYPANLKTKCFTQKIFREWSCNAAHFDIIWPEKIRLADFEKDDMSIIQRSAGVNMQNGTLEIVYVPDEVIPQSWNDDLSGKVLFVKNGYERWIERAIELHACGIVTVSMPEIKPVRVNIEEDDEIAERRANLSFHLYQEKMEMKLFGFTLSPKGGEYLQEICTKLKRKGEYPKANAFVEARLYDGFIENVVAEVLGETKEQVLIVAHLCHPKSSVNDNASGVACAMEAIRGINSAIAKGELKKPRRTIRMLLMPEFTGTYAYLAENERRLVDIKAGVNLDMVGAKQNDNAGALLLIDTPDSAYSFVGDLGRMVLEEARKECPLAVRGQYTGLFNSEVKPFMLGSDHYILSDPAVGIPSIAITQWPDKMYHTSGDSLENIDSKMLYRVSSISAAYAYALADLEIEDSKTIMLKTRERIFHRINELNIKAVLEKIEFGERNYHEEWAIKTCEDHLRFYKGDERIAAQNLVEEEIQYIKKLFELSFQQDYAKEVKLGKQGLIVSRLFKAPLSIRSILAECSMDTKKKYEEIQEAHKEQAAVEDYIVYAINGRDDERTIAEKVLYETGVECLTYVHEFIRFLYQLNLIKIMTGELDND